MPDPLDIRTGQPLDYEAVRFVRSDNIRWIEPIDLNDQLRRRELVRKSGYRPSLAEKLGQAFGSDFGAGFYCGVWAGALFTVIAAYVIAFGGKL